MANNSTEEIVPLKSNVNKFTIVDNDEIPGCKRKVKKIINSHKFHTIIVILVVIDCLAVASELGINEIKGRQQPLRRFICDNIEKHKIELRSHIIEIRDHLRDAFDDFFNNLLFTIRKDWNLFNVQEVLVK